MFTKLKLKCINLYLVKKFGLKGEPIGPEGHGPLLSCFVSWSTICVFFFFKFILHYGIQIFYTILYSTFFFFFFFWRMKLATINIQNWLNQPAQYGECLVVHLPSRQLDLALSMLFLPMHVLHYSLDDKHENI